MAKPNRRPNGPIPPGASPQGGRPSLIPSDPLPGWLALTQVAFLVGVPLVMLLAFKLVLKRFFPELGY